MRQNCIVCESNNIEIITYRTVYTEYGICSKCKIQKPIEA